MNEMIERVKAALATYSCGCEGSAPGVVRIRHGRDLIEEFAGWCSLTVAQAKCEDMNARAAIAAMCEPTEAMIRAGEPTSLDAAYPGSGFTADCWSAMIAEAQK